MTKSLDFLDRKLTKKQSMLRRAVILFAIFLTASSGGWNDTPTGIDLDMLPHFPLSKIHSGRLGDGSTINFDGIIAAAGGPDDRQVRLRGTGQSGRPWEVHFSTLDEVWRGDLDGNGTQDYVFFNRGPYGNGRMTPVFSLSILLMDTDRMPVPFFTTVYKGENGDSIKHVLDLSHDGRAELLVSNYDENASDPHVIPMCSGHWVHQLYRFIDFGAEEIRGTRGGIKFPFVYNWSLGKKCSDDQGASYPLEAANLEDDSTSTRAVVTTRLRTKADNVDLMEIDPVHACKQIRASVLVYDHPAVREIAFPNLFTSSSTDLSEKIRRAKARVELRGLHKNDSGCFVNVLWAN